ncbi:MAG: M28 family peptidase [Candidatus Sericytochromatia bacterium]|nr:M28 family peptidase [Candidatus Tanganyikabacteria bacterium]
MRRASSRAAAALAVALSLGAPAQAATAGDFDRMRLLGRLPADVPMADLRAIDTVLALPVGARVSPAFAAAAAPDWRRLKIAVAARARAERDPAGAWRRVHARFQAFGNGPAAAAAPVVPFDLARYRKQVTALSQDFKARLMGFPDHDLAGVCDYLEAHYRKLGLRVERQTFRYAGRQYQNVIATLPGRSAEKILLVDHFDVAPTADYEPAALSQAPGYGLTPDQIQEIRAGHRTGAPVPGADDNASGTAALLESAQALVAAGFKGGKRPDAAIQFVHLNGEEFPGDSYGAKRFVARALARRERVASVIVLDMIAVNRQKDRVFQLAPGPGKRSAALADLAAAAAGHVAPGYTPAMRLLADHRSYLYNTDAQVFAAAGYPVLLLNEHLNYHEDLDRLGYHDEFDRVELIDWEYAGAIARTGLATALLAAGRSRAPEPGETNVLRSPAQRASLFQIEVRYSPLYEAVLARERAVGRPLRDAELDALIRRDLAVRGDPAQHDSSVALRLTTWFRPPGWRPMGIAEIRGEIRYQRLRDRVYRGQPF